VLIRNSVFIILIFRIWSSAFTLEPSWSALYGTLEFPVGAQFRSMGDVGITDSKDPSVAFCSPAAVALNSRNWKNGSIVFDREILDKSVHRNFWAAAYTIQRKWSWSTAAYLNSISYGIMQRQHVTNGGSSFGPTGESVDDIEMTAGVGLGVSIPTTDRSSHNIGINIKYFSHAFFDGARAICADIGYVRANKNFQYFCHIKNVGTGVKYQTHFPRKSTQLPMELFIGAGYNNDFTKNSTSVADLCIEGTLGKRFFDLQGISFGQTIQWNMGIRSLFLRTLIISTGWSSYSFDQTPNFHSGLGLSLFNHIDFNGYVVMWGTGGDNNYGWSITIRNLFRWVAMDRTWWRK
jgi:hypothetical protein